MKKGLVFLLPFLVLFICCNKQSSTSEMSPALAEATTRAFKTQPVKVSKEMAHQLEQVYHTRKKSKAQAKVSSFSTNTKTKALSDDVPQEPLYDFTSAYSMTTYDDVSQTNYTFYYVNETGYDPINNPINYTVFFLPTTNSGYVPITLRTQATTLETYSTSFYDSDNTFLLQLDVTGGSLSNVTAGDPVAANGFGDFFRAWGNCLLDVYSNHGGASALAMIASVVSPPTVGYFAMRCAGRNVSLW